MTWKPPVLIFTVLLWNGGFCPRFYSFIFPFFSFLCNLLFVSLSQGNVRDRQEDVPTLPKVKMGRRARASEAGR